MLRMKLVEPVKLDVEMALAVLAKAGLLEKIHLERAQLRVSHRRPQDFTKDPITGLYTVPVLRSYKNVDDDEVVLNQKTDVGIVQLHTQGYGTSGLLTNGFNYIALTNSAITPAHGDTTLAGEIVANGLSRAQGTVTLPTGTGTQTTVDHTFICATAPQAAQAAALFTAASVGVMNHELTFTQRSLQIGDTLQTTYTITLS
jgi:hypothetical protein